MYATYIGDGRMLIAPVVGGKLLAPADDLSLMPDLAIFGAFDIALTNFITSKITKQMTVVDIGANIGYITMLLGYQSKKVFAYEASPKNFEYVEQNVKMNYLKNVESFQLAVSSKHGDEISFYEPTRFRGSGSVKPSLVDSFKINAPFDTLNQIVVPTVTIDEHLKGQKIDFMKMDIEGGEYQAFLGMEQTIKERRLGAVAFEMNSSALDDELDATRELIHYYKNKFDARIFVINGDGDYAPYDIDAIFAAEHVDNAVVSFV